MFWPFGLTEIARARGELVQASGNELSSIVTSVSLSKVTVCQTSDSLDCAEHQVLFKRHAYIHCWQP